MSTVTCCYKKDRIIDLSKMDAFGDGSGIAYWKLKDMYLKVLINKHNLNYPL
jgi:hypothetical protein